MTLYVPRQDRPSRFARMEPRTHGLKFRKGTAEKTIPQADFFGGAKYEFGVRILSLKTAAEATGYAD